MTFSTTYDEDKDRAYVQMDTQEDTDTVIVTCFELSCNIFDKHEERRFVSALVLVFDAHKDAFRRIGFPILRAASFGKSAEACDVLIV